MNDVVGSWLFRWAASVSTQVFAVPVGGRWSGRSSLVLVRGRRVVAAVEGMGGSTGVSIGPNRDFTPDGTKRQQHKSTKTRPGRRGRFAEAPASRTRPCCPGALAKVLALLRLCASHIKAWTLLRLI